VHNKPLSYRPWHSKGIFYIPVLRGGMIGAAHLCYRSKDGRELVKFVTMETDGTLLRQKLKNETKCDHGTVVL
jgi:hypothetical protein